MSSELDQQRREIGNSVIDKLRHTLKRAEDRQAFNNPRFAERWEAMESVILVYFSLGTSANQFVACFQRELVQGNPLKSADRSEVWRRASTFGPEFPQSLQILWGSIAKSGTTCCDQKTVLVDNVKFVELPEQSTSTFVWFDVPNRILRFFPRSLYLSLDGRFEFAGIIDNWKIDSDKRPTAMRTDFDELVRQIIKRTAKIVDDIPGDNRNAGRDVITSTQIANVLSGLRIALDSKSVWIGCEKLAKLKLEVVKVLIGPMNF